MFKFLLLLFLFIYIIAKVGGFIMRALFSGFSSQSRQTFQSQNQRTQKKQPRDGNVIIEYNPKEKQNKSGSNFKGGDYVNYEEVD